MQDQSLYSHINNPSFPEQEHLNCPRCESPNTKFCYYNNYNLSQPRHYCKNCKRYWTKGGSLRNIPVGGGSRKNSKRSSTTKKPSSSTTTPSASPAVPSASSVVPSVSSSITGSLSSPKAALDKDLRIFSGLLGPANEGQSGNLRLGDPGSGSGSGSDEVRIAEQQTGNSATSTCWNSGSEWPDLSIFTPPSKFK